MAHKSLVTSVSSCSYACVLNHFLSFEKKQNPFYPSRFIVAHPTLFFCQHHPTGLAFHVSISPFFSEMIRSLRQAA